MRTGVGFDMASPLIEEAIKISKAQEKYKEKYSLISLLVEM